MNFSRFNHLSVKSDSINNPSNRNTPLNLNTTPFKTPQSPRNDENYQHTSPTNISIRLDSPRLLSAQFYASSFELSSLNSNTNSTNSQSAAITPASNHYHLEQPQYLNRKNSIKIKRSLLNQHRPLSYIEMSTSNASSSSTNMAKSNESTEGRPQMHPKIAPRPTQLHHHYNQHNLHHHTASSSSSHHSPHLSILDIKHFSSNLSMPGAGNAVISGDNEQPCSLSSSSSSSCSSNSNDNAPIAADDVILISTEDVISKSVAFKIWIHIGI